MLIEEREFVATENLGEFQREYRECGGTWSWVHNSKSKELEREDVSLLERREVAPPPPEEATG